MQRRSRALRSLRRRVPPWLRRDCERLANSDPSIASLECNGKRIGNVGASALGAALQKQRYQKKPHLAVLSLMNNEITSSGIQAIAKGLDGGVLVSLQEVNLSFNDIGNDGVKVLCRVFSTARTNSNEKSNLKRLVLHRCNIGNEGVVALSKLLQGKDCQLQSLFLGHNDRISMEGWHALGLALRSNATLKTLNVMNARLNTRCATVLFAHLRHNTSLETLFLFHNNIGNGGATALASLLQAVTKSHRATPAPPLKNIFLKDNQISQEGAMALAHGIKDNVYLEQLELVGNSITKIGVSALLRILQNNNRTIKHLKVIEDRSQQQDTQVNRTAQVEIDFYCSLNRVGRRFLGHVSTMRWSLWPHVLAKKSMNENPSLLFWFLREKPEIFQRHQTYALQRQRTCRKRRYCEI